MDITIQQQQTVTQRTLSATVEDMRYTLTLTQSGDTITQAQCVISRTEQITTADNESVSSQSYQGEIAYNNGTIQTQHIALADTAQHIAVFSQILEQVKGGEV